VILVGKIQILYYLEDITQENFITAIVKRIAMDEEIHENPLN